MKVTETHYTIELTETEVRRLVATLETEYKYRGKDADIRELRNAFANIIHRTYSGADA